MTSNDIKDLIAADELKTPGFKKTIGENIL